VRLPHHLPRGQQRLFGLGFNHSARRWVGKAYLTFYHMCLCPSPPSSPCTSQHNDLNGMCLPLFYHLIALRVRACMQRHGVVSTIEANETYYRGKRGLLRVTPTVLREKMDY
jgi:hypothetical protein